MGVGLQADVRFRSDEEQFRRESLGQVSARPGPRHFGEAGQAVPPL